VEVDCGGPGVQGAAVAGGGGVRLGMRLLRLGLEVTLLGVLETLLGVLVTLLGVLGVVGCVVALLPDHSWSLIANLLESRIALLLRVHSLRVHKLCSHNRKLFHLRIMPVYKFLNNCGMILLENRWRVKRG
jgi:hypothetical protein